MPYVTSVLPRQWGTATRRGKGEENTKSRVIFGFVLFLEEVTLLPPVLRHRQLNDDCYELVLCLDILSRPGGSVPAMEWQRLDKQFGVGGLRLGRDDGARPARLHS